MSIDLVSEIASISGLQVEEHRPLAPEVYYRIGGSARFWVELHSPAALLSLWELVRRHKVPIFVLGSGTNLLFDDKGFPGVVLNMGPKWIEPEIRTESGSGALWSVSARVAKADLLAWSIRQGHGGLEFSAGIPGTMGGAVRMNAGTKWGAYKDVVRTVRLVCPKRGLVTLAAEELGLSYRAHSTTAMTPHSVVWDLEIELGSQNCDQARVLEILRYRGLRQPLEWPSCGSVFKNPENSEKGAGRWIEAVGLKGMRIGDVEVSQQHANFFINRGAARSEDVRSLIEVSVSRVLAAGGPKLEPEVIVVDPARYLLD